MNLRRAHGLPRLGTTASAVLCALAFPPHEYGFLIWFALVPWLRDLWRCPDLTQRLVQAFWFQAVLGAVATQWIITAGPRYLEASQAMGWALWLVHAAISQLHFVVFAGVLHFVFKSAGQRLGFVDVLLASLAFVAFDALVPNVFRDTLGIALHDTGPLVQIIDLGGTRLLTFIVVFVNIGLFAATLAIAAVGSKAGSFLRDLWAIAVFAVLLLASAGLYGNHRLDEIERERGAIESNLLVGVVQASVPNELKSLWARGDEEAADAALRAYLEPTAALFAAGSPPELVVWPETAYPGVYRKPESEGQLERNVAFDRTVAKHESAFLFGAYDRVEGASERVLRNSMFLVQPVSGAEEGRLAPMQAYHKHILFPVGEVVPFVERSTAQGWFPGAGSFARGEGPRVLTLETRRDGAILLGPAICYEDLFPRHLRALAKRGARLLVNISNDGWFGDTGLPRFHLIFAKLASIETRLPQVRATNSGYSAVILPTGEIASQIEYGATQALLARIKLGPPSKTLATRFGGWFELLAFAGTLAIPLRLRRSPR